MAEKPPIAVRQIEIDSELAGQRIDNFLVKTCKGVPKSRLYKALRKGEVRVNKKRVQADYRLQEDDTVRIPPLRQGEQREAFVPEGHIKALTDYIMYEDDDFIVLNKPIGIAVHGGSGVDYGVIEALRLARPNCRALELVHRLDRDTSGCLLLGKKSSITKALQEQFREKKVEKIYLMLVHGQTAFANQMVELPLERYLLPSGERMVRVSKLGKTAMTQFTTRDRFAKASFIQARLLTGRTHQ
ncbi:MAG: pseudouridine synthase, partial [Pseudomonadota bacterium]|nr:pseudouridine synthase [Pseudomonadota bacterium]